MYSSQVEPFNKTINKLPIASAVLENILYVSSDAMLIIDSSQKILLVNRALEELFIYNSSELVGQNLQVLLPEPTRFQHIELVKKFEEESDDHRFMNERKEVQALRSDGSLVAVKIAIGKLLVEGKILFTAVVREVAPSIDKKDELRGSRFRSLMEHSSNGIIIVNKDHIVTFVSSSYQNLLGYDCDERVGKSIFELINPIQLDSYKKVFFRVYAHSSYTENTEVEILHKNGTWKWFSVTLTNLLERGDIQGLVLNFHDITQYKQAEAALISQTMFDPLTGLPNRQLLYKQMADSSTSVGNKQKDLGVLSLDVDKFKIINDTLGHSAGDALLIQVASRLRSILRTKDVVSRVGGDEFVLLVKGDHVRKKAVAIASRIHDVMQEPIFVEDTEFIFSISIGITVGNSATSNPERLLADADAAMYHVKRRGGGQTEIFDEGLRQDLTGRLAMYTQLRSAIREDEFLVHFQPVVDTVTQKIVSYEALARWQHPTQGLLMPNMFLSYCEESGLIKQLGEQVLNKACEASARHKEKVGIPAKIAVNVSMLQLEDNSFFLTVCSALHRYSIPPACLVLEITEGIVMSNENSVFLLLKKLHNLGVGLSIDDYGVGYSSLQYLRSLPIEFLKIDMSLISNLGKSPADRAIVLAIITMAHQIGVQVVAEGVETVEQYNCLKKFECDLIQGFLFGRPIDTLAIELDNLNSLMLM